ncbi:MAG: amino acid ABC transporter substrate-binding protein [Anaerolineae bacterium]|nr:amino acid ABC transporter substrate-binding protein [Anaerolineae bacterium]MDQ7033716.1 amino acid ABC transporter substrate-binding protein [Anaerolineae bacterium]
MKHRFLLLFVLLCLALSPLLVLQAQDDMEMATCSGEPLTEDSPVIVIGAAVSDTGRYAREGGDTRNGYNLWLDWVMNEYGGINIDGVCNAVELIMYDDEGDSDTVSVLVERLIIEDEVDFILGPYSSGLTSVASVITERENVIMVEGNGASETLFERGFQNLFAVLTPASFYTRGGIELAYEQGARTGAIAYVDEAFSTSVAEGAQRWMEELGMEVLAFESYPSDATDLSSLVTNFRELEPDIVVAAGHFNDAVLFVNTIKDLDFNPQGILLTVGPSNPTFVEEVGADSYYLLGASQWESTLGYEDAWFGSAGDYAARFEEAYGIPPSYQAAESTATALALHLAIEAAGSADTDDVRTALQEMDIVTFYGPINFDETGKNAGKPMVTIQIQDGEINIVAPVEAAVADVQWPAPAWADR